ncbi:zinc finger MYM-type protein 1-like [Myzus persicae]|uniref:zinc finger MYM-type protein 1-like n=1 Tax=Myzus persicae TaxID=13164 RepID=UPI000B930861|nr:zinc finger MYM-type protein 1-like [Myzus persicae]
MKRGALDNFFKPKPKKPFTGALLNQHESQEHNQPVCSTSIIDASNVVKKWEWLAYSKEIDGAFCKYCVLFGKDYVGKGSNQKVGSLISKPFIKWKDSIEKFTSHSNTDYHRFCTLTADNFRKVDTGEMCDVATQLNSYRQQQCEENRAALIPIIETIIFCGEQELSLRGNDDSGLLNLSKPPKKDGKFRALLRFRANFGDENLKNHLINSNKNSTYLSPSIQNEIIDICGQLIRKNIVTKINEAGCFSILCDETLDVSGTEQLSMCVRYVDQNNQLREDFLCFLPVYDLTGENLTRIILEECEKLGLDLNKLIGQGYDGAGNMSGQFNGVQSRIRQLYPKAVFVHCASHRLNLALSSALSTKNVRNCLGVMKDIINLFRNNALAGETLKSYILELIPETKKTRLVGLCETRFIELHEAVNVFVEFFEPIIVSLQNIQDTDRAISAKACSLLAAVEKSCFIISLLVCENLLSFTLPLSHYLQSPKRDLSSAVDYAKHIIKKLKHVRQNPNESFTQIFQEARKLSKMYFDTEIKILRTTNKQNYRDNYSCPRTEDTDSMINLLRKTDLFNQIKIK